MHYRGKRKEWEDMETVHERYPNTAGGSPQPNSVQTGRASGAAGSSEAAEATTCGCPFGFGVGAAAEELSQELGPVLRGTSTIFGGDFVGPCQTFT